MHLIITKEEILNLRTDMIGIGGRKGRMEVMQIQNSYIKFSEIIKKNNKIVGKYSY